MAEPFIPNLQNIGRNIWQEFPSDEELNSIRQLPANERQQRYVEAVESIELYYTVQLSQFELSFLGVVYGSLDRDYEYIPDPDGLNLDPELRRTLDNDQTRENYRRQQQAYYLLENIDLQRTIRETIQIARETGFAVGEDREEFEAQERQEAAERVEAQHQQIDKLAAERKAREADPQARVYIRTMQTGFLRGYYRARLGLPEEARPYLFHPEGPKRDGASTDYFMSPIPPSTGDCNICADSLLTENPVRLPCTHEYHRLCISQWCEEGVGSDWQNLSTKVSCPSCRRQYILDKVPDFSLQTIYPREMGMLDGDSDNDDWITDDNVSDDEDGAFLI